MNLTTLLILVGLLFLVLRNAHLGSRWGMFMTALLLIVVGVMLRDTNVYKPAPVIEVDQVQADQTNQPVLPMAPMIRTISVQPDASLLPPDASSTPVGSSPELGAEYHDPLKATVWPVAWRLADAGSGTAEACETAEPDTQEPVAKAGGFATKDAVTESDLFGETLESPTATALVSGSATSHRDRSASECDLFDDSRMNDCNADGSEVNGDSITATVAIATGLLGSELHREAETTENAAKVEVASATPGIADGNSSQQQTAGADVAELKTSADGEVVESTSEQEPTAADAATPSGSGVSPNENEPKKPSDDAAAHEKTTATARTAVPLDREPQLSMTKVSYPDREAGAPAWLEREKSWKENRTVYMAVSSGLHLNEPECEKSLAERLRSATARYIEELLGSRHASLLLAPEIGSWANGAVTESFQERVLFSRGEMQQQHALVAFDDSFRDEVEKRWRLLRRFSRTLQVALGAGVVLLLLSVTWGYTRVDTMTRGYYTRWLQSLAIVVVLTLIGAAIYLGRSIPWL